MSNRSRQNRDHLCGNRTKSAIPSLVLLVFLFPAPSWFNVGASAVQAQTGSNSPPFELQMGQKYSHPLYPELRIALYERMIIVNGVPDPYRRGLPMPIELSELPENRWIQLETLPRPVLPGHGTGGQPGDMLPGDMTPGDKMPVAIMRGSCNVMRGCSVMAQWLP